MASQRLQAKVESFRTQKETIKAQYTAAEAQTRINEAFSGISEEMGDVGMAVQRAEDKTAQMQARAGAIDELIASGALDDASSMNRGDDISRELDAMSSQSDVEAELAALKAGTPQAALDAADSTAPRPRSRPASPARRRAGHDRPHPQRGPVGRRGLGPGAPEHPRRGGRERRRDRGHRDVLVPPRRAARPPYARPAAGCPTSPSRTPT